MFRKTRTTFAGSFAAQAAARAEKPRAMMELLEDRKFLSAPTEDPLFSATAQEPAPQEL
jgi:hypothetical protein